MIGFLLVNFVFNPIKAMKNIMKELSVVFIEKPNYTTRLFKLVLCPFMVCTYCYEPKSTNIPFVVPIPFVVLIPVYLIGYWSQIEKKMLKSAFEVL